MWEMAKLSAVQEKILHEMAEGHKSILTWGASFYFVPRGLGKEEALQYIKGHPDRPLIPGLKYTTLDALKKKGLVEFGKGNCAMMYGQITSITEAGVEVLRSRT
jgi:hypothetical protein